MYLVDTNIFLEILLKQAKSQTCKDFLDQNVGDLSITDFSLHSIGVILFRQFEHDLFLKFLNDTLPKVNLTSLPKELYKEILTNRKKKNLDFDDAYQYSVSLEDFLIPLVPHTSDARADKTCKPRHAHPATRCGHGTRQAYFLCTNTPPIFNHFLPHICNRLILKMNGEFAFGFV